MERKQKVEVGLMCLLFLGLAGVMDQLGTPGIKGGELEREDPGQGKQELELILNAEGVVENYNYPVTVTEYRPTEAEAQDYFKRAKEEIDDSFYENGEDSSRVTQKVNIAEEYVQGAVKAEWSFDRLDLIDPEGTVIKEAVPEEGIVVEAYVELSCGAYREMYAFPFQVVRGTMSEAGALLDAVEQQISAQQSLEGEKFICLPQEAEGVSLSWESKKEHLVWKILFMEGVVLLLIPIVGMERKKAQKKAREQQLLLDYPDIVSQLTILVGAGMSVRQSWSRISARYIDKRQKKLISQRWGYEELTRTVRQMEDGKGERRAYEDFGVNMGLRPYHRLVRILVENLQKGNRRLVALLEQESEAAFEERTLLAKKMGEEASTRMLFPLILMMVVVMAIVIVPAIIEFV